MSEKLQLNPKTSALLLLAFQTAIVDGPAVPGDVVDKEALLARTASIVEAARKGGMKVIYVVLSFRQGYPEVSPRNMSFSAIRETGRFVEGSSGTEVHPDVAPMPGDVIVTKRRGSALSGTDLEMVLRANGIDTLVLCGISTGGVVLSTLRHAADADYRLVVVADCCADRDPEVHRVLTEKVFPRQATVTTAEGAVGALDVRS
jgi:nicotinamidase-related amidase